MVFDNILNSSSILKIRFSNQRIKRAVGFTLAIAVRFSLPAMANDEEKLWQQKSQLVIDRLADNYTIPKRGDLGKYLMPSLIAHRWRKGNLDSQQLQQLQLLTNKKAEDFYTNSDAFSSPGITRLLYLYPQDKSLQQVERQYFKYLFPPTNETKKYNFWESGGTENFVNMLRTSGYLLAQKAIELELPKAREKSAKKEAWLRYKARRTYQMGTAEWDSSSYTVFNLIGWLNVYDFAENESIKGIAKAVLDYYASAIALKYTYGVYGGAEQRGGSAISSFNSYTDYLGWLWFSEYIPEEKSFFKWPKYIQLIHPATSSYRPPIEAIALARKQVKTASLYYNVKANYGLAFLETPELFYIDKTYTLGTALAVSGEQIINWKLVSYPDESKPALVVTGSNSYSKERSKNGIGKTVFDRYMQYENVLIQMSYVPEEVKSQLTKQKFRRFLINTINKIPCGNTCKHLLSSRVNKSIPPITYPIVKQKNKYYVSNYLSFPQDTKIINRQGIYFVRLNETYLAIFPFPEQPNLKTKTQADRIYLEATAPLDTLVGFAIEAGNSVDNGDFQQFQDSIIQKTKLDLNQLEWEKVRYLTLDKQQLLVDYNKSQKQASLRVNNRPILWQTRYLYQGENLRLKEQILEIESAESIYQVNFQDKTPTFKRIVK